ncbi:MAG: hypothetical protein WA885_18355 [Phormidesmis sp.]
MTRAIRLGLTASTAALVAIGMEGLPVWAEVLSDWGYDSQTRSLTIVLPYTVAPSISVVAPNQLLLELPDTQVGDVAGQTVGDGLVESIMLEQTTPETVWMVVDFVPGTVLADVQNATPLATNDENSRQWQVRPALMASSSDGSSDAIAATPQPSAPSSIPATLPSPAAASLRTPAATLAQSPDFPDLPVLEPAMPLNEPVSVPPLRMPPIDAAPTVEAAPVEVAPPSDIVEAPVQVPIISDAVPPEPEPVVANERDSEPIVVNEPEPPEIEADEVAIDELLPAEPPFIGEVGAADLPKIEAAPVVAVPEPLLAEPLLAVPEPVVAVPNVAPDVVVTERSDSEVLAESAAIAAIESTTESAPIAPLIDPTPLEPITDPAVELPAESIRPANTNRWPEPVPFGQPLP